MSNDTDHPVQTNVKTITIKPLPYIQHTYEKSTRDQFVVSEEEQLQTTIIMAEARLKELKQEQLDVQVQTEEQIQQQREAWEQERNKLVAVAKEEGYQAGFEIAKQEVMKQYEHKLIEANQLIKTAEEEHMKRIEQSTDSLIGLSVHIAEKIINKEIRDDQHAFLSLVQAATEEVKEQPEISIHVPSEHYEFILLQKNELVQLMNGTANVSIYVTSDKDCYITHPLGRIDLSIDTQLTQMRDKLIEIASENQL